MEPIDSKNLCEILEQMQAHVELEHIRITQHAQVETIEDNYILDDLIEAVKNGQILEYYPEHPRGACCLLYGHTLSQRPIHIVCTTEQPVLIIITVYEPKLPKWITETQRRPKI
ncbi:MAG: DUF4258 domain-containing protein [Candidatus Eremiobacterota bacterium]